MAHAAPVRLVQTRVVAAGGKEAMAAGAVHAHVGARQGELSRPMVETRLLETHVERMARGTVFTEKSGVAILVACRALGILQQIRACRTFGYGSGR
jgi:hypothetical protein